MKFEGYIFDLDGTVYLGDALLPTARETILHLRQANRKVLFLSNKPIADRASYAQKLTRLGIQTDPSEVLNSSFVAAQYFKQEMPWAKFFVMGECALVNELSQAGLQFSNHPSETDVVLISLDRDLSYKKLHFAYHAAKKGAKIWATNPDLVCPMPNDEIIDAGATIAALEALLRRPIDGIIGKPSRIMVRTLIQHLALPPENCIMVGDRLETDIVMGKTGGMATALVLTGVASREDVVQMAIEPDWVLESLQELLAI